MTPSPTPSEGEAMLKLADAYECGLERMIASGYEEFGPNIIAERRLIVKALRADAQSTGVRVDLGDLVHMNETSPYFHEWRGLKLKVVGLRLAPNGQVLASVVEGEARHRGNGYYDGETSDIDVSHLSLRSPDTSD